MEETRNFNFVKSGMKVETSFPIDSLWTKRICAEPRMIKNAIPKKKEEKEKREREREKGATQRIWTETRQVKGEKKKHLPFTFPPRGRRREALTKA